MKPRAATADAPAKKKEPHMPPMHRVGDMNRPNVPPDDVASALSGLVVSPDAAQLAGLAVSSGSSLFIYGPSGNGKSSLSRMVHGALHGDFWIPYCISIGNSIIRLFDEACHQSVEI